MVIRNKLQLQCMGHAKLYTGSCNRFNATTARRGMAAFVSSWSSQRLAAPALLYCAGARRSSAVMLVFFSMLLSSASAAGPYVDVPSALKGMPDASTFWAACQAAGLDKDEVFINSKWEGLI
jgi:hypothetical protein